MVGSAAEPQNPTKTSVGESVPVIAPRATMTAEEAIAHLKSNTDSKLKPAMKCLLKTHTTAQQQTAIVECLKDWSVARTERKELISLCPKLINYLRMFAETVPDSSSVTRLLMRMSLSIATTPQMLASPERARAVKALLIYAITRVGAPSFIAFWTTQILASKRTLDETLAEWIEQWSIAGESKLEWENFFNKHGPKRAIKMESSLQTTQMTIQQEGEPKAAVETVIVWNGNGARARWADKAELKQVVRSADPDVLCFLEGKTNAENLLRLPHFREWISAAQYRQVNCYWSLKDDKKGFGNEGIILFSKLPCEVKYGIGNEDLDKQARAITVEFADCIMLFTYNPQGGFTQESLAFRTRWEAALQSYIRSVSLDAMVKQKRMIWAGDLNVNPTDADWSMRAFDRIKHRIPKGTAPVGCREVDQKAYCDLKHSMNGVNVAEHFQKHTIRTCFQSEEYLRRNYGQRIDHVIAEASLLRPESELRITAFDTLIQFRASRKGSSDHCPLWFKLERGHSKPVLAIATAEPTPKAKLDEILLKKIQELMAPPKFADMEPSTEFENYSSDEEDGDEWDNIACAAFESEDFQDASDEKCMDEAESKDDDSHTACSTSEAQGAPFEDCSSPILQCHIRGTTSVEKVPAKVLVDSGSTLDLISGKMARKLERLGHKTHEVNKGIRIKVANGRRSTLNQAMTLQLIVQEEHTEPTEWLVLEDLPFDMILGSETCKKWKAIVDWDKSRFTMTPRDKEIVVDWNLYNGQHWRKPVVLTAKETLSIPPHSQMILEVINNFKESEGYACKGGLVTPVREQAVLTQKFSVAYIYGEGVTKISVANTSSTEVTITRGTAVAEFHPRTRENIDFLHQEGTGGCLDPQAQAAVAHDSHNDSVLAVVQSLTPKCRRDGQQASMNREASEREASEKREASNNSCSALHTTIHEQTQPATAAHELNRHVFLNRQGEGDNNELSRVVDTIKVNRPVDDNRVETWRGQLLEPSSCSNWEADFGTDPLKSVDISHLAKERTVELAFYLALLSCSLVIAC